MKKLIITNSVFAMLLTGVFVLGYYFLQYPEEFNISRYIRNAEWKIFVTVMVAIFIAAIFLSFIPIKKLAFVKKTLVASAGLQALFLSLLLFKIVQTYIKNKNYFEGLVSEYKKKADLDMKAGLIVVDYTGGLEMPPNEKEQRMIRETDSIRRTFGLTYWNSGCIVTVSLQKAQQEYIKYTQGYLDKRNGLGWQIRMRQQIEQIQQNYP